MMTESVCLPCRACMTTMTCCGSLAPPLAVPQVSAAHSNPVTCCLVTHLVAVMQVANRPFRFLRIVRTIRYVRGLRMLAATIVSAIPATLKVSMLA